MITSNCSNCGKYGHNLKNCNEPMTSVGIVCFKLDKMIFNKFIKNLENISYYDLNHIMMDNIHKFTQYNDYIKFLLVKRRHSLNYIDFIRGKYDINNLESIKLMCSYMSCNEIELIRSNDFNNLWNNLWMKNAHKKKYLEELNQSKNKFEYLKNSNFFDTIDTVYESTEWEIPKGRKISSEKNLNCAIREFKEETSIDTTSYQLINSVDPIHDIFIGTNGKEYRHIFYTSLFTGDNENITNNNNEIDMVQWYNWSELNDLFRSYNSSKINILTNIFLFIINVCESNNYQFKNKTLNNINVNL